MSVNILFGGPAGTGPNILTHVLAEALVKKGYYVFYSRDYQSLIRGGHNFNVLTFSNKSVNSNDSQIDILVCLDENTKKLHEKELNKGGTILEGKNTNMYFAGRVFKLLGLDFESLDERLKHLEKRYDENVKEAKEGYEKQVEKIKIPESPKINSIFRNGSQGIVEGALKSGLEFYYAYPMTPATTVLTELSQAMLDKKNKHLTIELENEIAIVNAGVGSALTGAKTMVGTSGGGFDLMTEGLSLTGIAEVPLVFYLSMRPGPATGVATYTGQGDLKLALNAGHGEFQRFVVAGGDPLECQELTNQAFYFSHKYQIPSIVISDKHLGESFYSLFEKPKIESIKVITKLKRYNSYEKDKEGSATEDAEIIKKNILRRGEKEKEIEKESRKFERYKIFGKQNSKNVVLSWGSTKGAILDAVNNLDCKFIQILFLNPFPKEIKKELEGRKIILVENNSTGQLGDLIKEKIGIDIEEKNKILRFDGRPFFADELKEEIEGRI
jgi:2-oxoglutarate/2-oxoacid ferredoxin oxidoreductase subunit alpha